MAADPAVTARVFRERGEQRYAMDFQPAGILFEVGRLSRRSKELWGEFRATVNGCFSRALTFADGVLITGDVNFSSINARERIAKILQVRSRADHLDWHGFIEDFATRIIHAERQGKPAVVLAEVELDEREQDAWDVQGLPILKTLPMVIFGSGGAAKSYLALWIAGLLAQRGVAVLYADWEFAKRDHRKRLGLLFQPMPKALFYATCDRPLTEEADRLGGLIHDHQIQYLVCDSMVFALDGPADDERAGSYFRTLRRFNIGSLNVAHTTKADDDRQKQVYGSVFFQNGARSIWFAQRAEQAHSGCVEVGLYHRKSNISEMLAPVGVRLLFQRGVTKIERMEVGSVDELAAGLPLLDRMQRALITGAMPYAALAEEVNATVSVLRKMVSRHKSVFRRCGTKVGLVSTDLEF